MMKIRQFALSLIGLLAAVTLAPRARAAQNVRIDFDPQKTRIEFALADFMPDVHGVFRLRSGSIQFDRQSGSASGSLIVDASSGDSGVGSRDSKMKRDILEAARFPDIVFLPKNVIGSVPESGSATIQVQGVFRIHGTDHQVTLPVSLTVNGSAFELTTKFAVPYVAWGMKDPSAFILRVGKEVGITINAAGQVIPSP
ncbi:MAG TPA: YceI family protein [Thermoanaerobaculia bacterium]|nr:YceI family protein [Thermoanaerobaculia bacterium]